MLLLPTSVEDAKAYLVMEKIEGTLARHSIGDKLLAQQAHIQAKLHQLGIQALGEKLLTTMNDPLAASDLELLLNELEDQIEHHQLKGFVQLIGYLHEKLGRVQRGKPTLLHNDFHPENVIVQEKDEALFVIDWGFANFGDARMDLVWTLLQIEHMHGKPERRKYLDYYEQASGNAISDLEFFEVLKLGQRLVTIATWLLPNFATPIKKIDAKAIRGDYKVHVLKVYARMKEILGSPIELFEKL